MPTGRVFVYEKDIRGNWPETTIKNYPVQGTGADIMSIIRVDFRRRFQKLNLDAVRISTVHDSIVVDSNKKDVDKIIKLFFDVYKDMPQNFQKLFGIEYNLPLFCEVSVGNNLYDLEEIKEGTI